MEKFYGKSDLIEQFIPLQLFVEKMYILAATMENSIACSFLMAI
jgi:hypothetical protein